MYSDGMSVLMWIGRVGNRIGAPWGGQCTTRRINGERGDMMIGPLRAVTRGAAARRNIKIAPRSVRPGILHPRRQRNRLPLDQLRAGDVNVVMGQVSPDICIERDFLRRRLSLRQSRQSDAAGCQ